MFSLDDFDQLKLNKIIVNTATKNSPKNIEEYMKEIEVDLELVFEIHCINNFSKILLVFKLSQPLRSKEM